VTLSNAERQRRYRKRLRTGAVVAPVELRPDQIARLLDCGWISEHEAEDLTALGRALMAAWDRSPPIISPQNSVTALRTCRLNPDRINVDPKDCDE